MRGALACRLGRYDTGVVSGALVLMDDELRLSATQKECVVSSAVLLAAMGAVVGGVASERWGRKLPINMASVFFVVGALVVGFAPSYHVRPSRKHQPRFLWRCQQPSLSGESQAAEQELANSAQLLLAATPRRLGPVSAGSAAATYRGSVG